MKLTSGVDASHAGRGTNSNGLVALRLGLCTVGRKRRQDFGFGKDILGSATVDCHSSEMTPQAQGSEPLFCGAQVVLTTRQLTDRKVHLRSPTTKRLHGATTLACYRQKFHQGPCVRIVTTAPCASARSRSASSAGRICHSRAGLDKLHSEASTLASFTIPARRLADASKHDSTSNFSMLSLLLACCPSHPTGAAHGD